MSSGVAPWDYIAKLVCIGDSGCGKSSLTIRLCEGRFSPNHDVTIGVEFGSRIVPVGPPFSQSGAVPPIEQQHNGDDEGVSAASASTTTPGAGGKPSKPKATSKTTVAAVTASPLKSSTVVAAAPPPPPPPEQKHMKLSLWDTAGQETYKSVTRSYFRGASGALLVFDLSRRDTFVHVTDWLADLRAIAEPDIVVILVGNKHDLVADEDENVAAGTDADDSSDLADDEQDAPQSGTAETVQKQQHQKLQKKSVGATSRVTSGRKRQVTRTEAEAWARDNGVLEYVETSAKSGVNVEMAFMRVAERIYQNIMAGRYDLDDRRSGVKRQTRSYGPGGSGGGGGRGGPNRIKLNGTGTNGAQRQGGGCC